MSNSTVSKCLSYRAKKYCHHITLIQGHQQTATKQAMDKILTLFKSRIYLSDYTKILFLVSSLLLLGLLFVYSSSIFYSERYFGDPKHFFFQQLLFACFGYILMLIISVIHYSFWKRFTYPVLFLSALLLILVIFPAIGSEIYGARRWIRIGFVGIQPVEILKFSFIVWVADFLARKENELQVFSRSLMPIFVVFSFFAILLLLQPDFGSLVLLLGCTILMCYVAGTRLIYLIATSLCGALLGSILIFTNAYRMERILGFLSPWENRLESGYQLVNSLIAYGGGGILGRGLGNSLQKEYFLPQAHTEFIFAVLAEETGIWGILLVSGLFLWLMHTGFKIADKCNQPFGRNLSFGFTILIMLQTVIISPTKGIGLPFISYGFR